MGNCTALALSRGSSSEGLAYVGVREPAVQEQNQRPETYLGYDGMTSNYF